MFEVPQLDLTQQPYAAMQQRSDEWFESRKHRVTGSIVHKLLFPWGKRRTGEFPESVADFGDTVKKQQDEVFAEWNGEDPVFSESTRRLLDFGIEHEAVALSELINYRFHVGLPPQWFHDLGLLIDPQSTEFGASIDGLFHDGIAEAKCSMYRPYAHGYRDYHYDQMQWNLGVTMAALGGQYSTCWFVGYNTNETVVQEVPFDEDYFRGLRKGAELALERYVKEWLPTRGFPVPGHLQKYV